MDCLRVVLQVHKENQLFAKYIQCEFWLSLVAFLCHIISSEGVELYPSKTNKVKNYPRPLTPTDIRRIFGLMGYYRKFVDGFASIATTLTTLTQKSIKFECSEAWKSSTFCF